MSIHNNFPTISWIKLDGISVTKGEDVYIVKDFKTNLKYIYWCLDNPTELTSSNVMLSRTSERFLIAVNDRGECILVPNDNIVVSFDGNSVDSITEHIWGLHEKDSEYGNRFVSVEQNIEGITQTVGQHREDIDSVSEYVSKVDQKADEINLSVKEVKKEYSDDKQAQELRENVNSSIININSHLGIFKSELSGYFKDNKMSDEEVIKTREQLEILKSSKTELDTYIDKVISVAQNKGYLQEATTLESTKTSLDNIHNNLISVVENSIIDKVITSTEITNVIDAFGKYNAKVNEVKSACDDIIILGMGGTISEALSKIDMTSEEIKLSVSNIETEFRDELNSQGNDIKNVDKKYAEITVNLETGITSKIENINTKIDGSGGIAERLQSAEQKILPDSITNTVKNSQFGKNIQNGISTNSTNISNVTQTANSISQEVSKKVGKTEVISSINQTAESIKINASKINLNGYVTVSDLGSSGTTTIHGDRIQTGTINVDQLNSNNSNPIIRLFNNCSIDATLKNEQGQGNSIRLKADNENYIKVQPTGYLEDGTYIGAHTAIFSGFYPNHEVMVFQGNASWGRIRTTQGILSMYSNGVYYGWNGNTNDNKLAYTSDVNSVRTTATTANTNATNALNTANTANTNATNAKSMADSAYSLASGKISQYSSSYIQTGSHDPYYNDSYNLGYSGSRWNQLSAKYVYATNTYSMAIDNPVQTISDDSLNNVIDDVLIESPNIVRMNDKNAMNEKLVINVNTLKLNQNAHLFISEDDGGNIIVNESSLLALALLEIKNLKHETKKVKKIEDEVKDLKDKIDFLTDKINELVSNQEGGRIDV